jgi:hypothetical protein
MANALRELSARGIEAQDLEEMSREIRGISDRSAAIVLASWVERTLEEDIIRILPRNDKEIVDKLVERDGALSTFYGKIHLGYALNLYDETTRDNLDCLRRIRNAFAHTAIQIGFGTPEVISEVGKLKLQGDFVVDLGEISEQRRNYTQACLKFIVASRLRPLGEKFELIRQVVSIMNSRLPPEKQMTEEQLQALSKAAESLKAITPN